MSKKVAFDYSKAASFISNDEVALMKKLAEDAKAALDAAMSAADAE